MADPKDLIQAHIRDLLGDLVTSGRASPEKEGDLVGPYQLCEQLGEGGFGTVWRAQQREPVRREVALKLIKLGMDTRQVLSRFQRERQALAEMNHPYIAHFIEAGVGPQGTPFFAMELVPGVPITLWCEEHGASQELRLQLFRQVCEAVHHAHERRIIHRDLKPTNILVTMIDGRPVPKVIDFGIAKAIASDDLDESRQITRTHQWIGTPLYMAPEQIAGGCEPDPRTDVYALGVLLYELLTGTPPFDRQKLREAGPDEWKRLLHGTMPERPSQRARGVATDLDWVTMCALEKDRARRYASAAELGADVQRYLEGNAVFACPPSIAYRMRRWGTRHRKAVLIGAAGLTLGILAPTLPSLYRTAFPKQTTSAPPPAAVSGAIAPETGPIDLLVASKEQPFENSLGMKFVPVPGTKVLFSIWPTRVRDYANFAKATSDVGSEWKTQNLEGVPAGREPDHPVVGVNWLEAEAFCGWLTKKEVGAGRLPPGARYRLPTDEEWSFAVALPPEEGTTPADKDGKNDTHFPWGAGYPPRGRGGNYMDESFHARFPGYRNKAGELERWIEGYTDGFATTSPVNSYPPNTRGVYDLGGNAVQWCEDWYDASQQERVLRGASWRNSGPSALLSSRRVHYPSTTRASGLGFHCVLQTTPMRGNGVSAVIPGPDPRNGAVSVAASISKPVLSMVSAMVAKPASSELLVANLPPLAEAAIPSPITGSRP